MDSTGCLDELVIAAEVPGAEEVLEALVEENQSLEVDKHDDLLDASSGRPVHLSKES